MLVDSWIHKNVEKDKPVYHMLLFKLHRLKFIEIVLAGNTLEVSTSRDPLLVLWMAS